MNVEPVLFLDRQSVRPAMLCEVCGGECYAPGFACLRCERRRP